MQQENIFEIKLSRDKKTIQQRNIFEIKLLETNKDIGTTIKKYIWNKTKKYIWNKTFRNKQKHRNNKKYIWNKTNFLETNKNITTRNIFEIKLSCDKQR